ncbi:MAG: restriction endonuclease subunit S, partial [Planctomycetes bacterium]|nr:restriction endonuclease subunit S [Planctomycetota bacterium]
EKLIAKKRNIKQGAMQELLKPKEGWVMKKLGEIFTFSGGYSASREQLSNDGFCYLHYGDIHGAKKTFINVKNEYTEIPKLKISLKNVLPKSLLNDGDIVFVDASEDDEGTSRHIVVKNPDGVPYISGLHTIVAKSKADSVDNDYKRYCFQSAYIKGQFKFYAVGTKVSGISKTNIAKIEITLPSHDEQVRIAAIFSDMDAEISALETRLAKYKQIKQGMMQELLTGRTRLI